MLWPGAPPRSLRELAGRCDPATAAAIAALERKLYARGHMAWDGADLTAAVARFRPAPTPPRPPARPLAPLYPE